MTDRPPESGQGQDKARSKEGGSRGRRRRRKPDANGNRVESAGSPKDSGSRDGNVRDAAAAAPRERQPGQGRTRQSGGEATRPGRQGGDPQRAGGRPAKGSQRQSAPSARVDKPVPKPEKPEPPFKHVLRTYGLAVYETHQAAKADRDALADKAKAVDQLNIVIRAEGSMDDPELTSIGSNIKIFAGTAWALIHDRRVADGWYNEPR